MKNSLLITICLLFGSSLFAQTNWYEIPTGVSNELNAIDFPTSSVGYIVGSYATILKTTDGGQTWNQLALNGITPIGGNDEFTDVHFVDENVGFLVSVYSGVWKTVDGAQSWLNVSTEMCFPYTVYPTSGVDYVVGGGGCFQGAVIDVVVGSNSSQASISTYFGDTQEIVVEMSFSNSLVGLAAVKNEYMLRTIDGGATWDTISTGVADNLTSVIMVNDTLCYAGYEDLSSQGFGMLKSTDGGLSWAEELNAATFFYPSYLSVHAADNGDIYSGASPNFSQGGLIFESTDGFNWDYQNVGQPINDMTSYGSDVTFGVGDSGYVVVNTPLAELSVSMMDEVEFDVFPNPFQNEITIQNSKGKIMNASILDARGRIVQRFEISSASTTVQTSDLEQGVYFIHVEVNGKRGMKRLVKLF